jgi:hypothetical protein
MIVIPMAGLSSRFTAAGYKLPKYMLPLGGKTVFDHAVDSFQHYFDNLPFLFIARDVAQTGAFIEHSCKALGIKDFSVQLLSEPTSGQAETVELGVMKAGIGGNEALTIFNIDTFRPGFRFPDAAWWPESDGYLEVFRGSGANWSYVRPVSEDSAEVAETAEKRPISDLCCTGLYHFAKAAVFHAALARERDHPSAAELYVAPLFNHLIRQGMHIYFDIVPRETIIFCGVPREYEVLSKS